MGASVGGQSEGLSGVVRKVSIMVIASPALDHEGGILRLVTWIGAEPEPTAAAINADTCVAFLLPDEKRSGEILERSFEIPARGRVVDDRARAGNLEASSATEGCAVPHLAVAPSAGMVEVVETQRRASRDFDGNGAVDETEPVVLVAQRRIRVIRAFPAIDAQAVRHGDKKPG